MLDINKIYNIDCMEGLNFIPDNSIDCIVTSPPYNKGLYDKHKPHESDTWKQRNVKYGDFNDDLSREDYVNQQTKMLRECVRVLKPNGSIFYNHKSVIHDHKIDFPLYVFDFNVRQIIVWDRGSSPALAPIRFFPTTEYIFWITKTNIQPKFYRRGKYDKEVWRINPQPYKGHPAPFPYELVEQCILSTTDENDVVLDVYSGSGTTCMVAKELGRKYIGIELNKEYFDLSISRIDGIDQRGQTSIFTFNSASVTTNQKGE